MRKALSQQLGLVPESIPHSHARELARASAILDLLPHAAELVAKDLGKGTKGSRAGRLGMTGEQVLRATLLKQMHGWSYTDLAFALADSPTFRSFCRVGFVDRAPKRSTLAENIKRVRSETFEQVNRPLHASVKRIPTVSPVAAGGYFWIFFDSYRNYGNLGLQRQLWGTAIKIAEDGKYTTDPSHPAFYLAGQELGTGNHRAFSALDACNADGASCTSGINCCGGFCTDGVCGKPMRCAQLDEACTTRADCCDANDLCIRGFCSIASLD